MTNFDFLLSDPQFDSFSGVAARAERILHIDPAACVLNCRRAMEFAVKWMYSVDDSLQLPDDDDRLVRLMDNRAFRNLVGEDIWKKMKLIRSLGNNAAHDGDRISRDQAELCLENLFDFTDFVACCYSRSCGIRSFDISLVDAHGEEEAAAEAAEMQLERLMAENAALRASLTARREAQLQSYTPRPLDRAEYGTRKIYIEAMLIDAGWTPGQDCLTDVPLSETADREFGTADYILYGSSGLPLAIIEARRSCMDIAKGRHQAELCAELVEKQHGYYPVIFLTDGFDIYINDGSERRIAAFYSRADLERRRTLSGYPADTPAADSAIIDREYQQEAVQAVFSAFSQGQKRALLAMAAGTGKTRTAAALCALMMQLNLAKNVLYLAENSRLAAQSKKEFGRVLPSVISTDLCCGSPDASAPMVFATLDAMSEGIDRLETAAGKLFTCGSFDLVICDEAHGSAAERHRDLFSYFDAPLLCMTAAPADSIDASVYELFALPASRPTYDYDMSRAIRDGYLVDFRIAEAKVKFIQQGIHYKELSGEDKAEYRLTFSTDGETLPESISSAVLNRWVFNADTIREALDVVMKNAIHVNKGRKIGKTIIFAANYEHASMIFRVFREMYPKKTGYAKILTHRTRDAAAVISRFSNPRQLPQIIISPDVFDSGMDLPQVVNLVFFKKVTDKARFWQMIGRGARPCPGMMNGQDKKLFHVFDFCGNFEYFRSAADRLPLPLPGELFALKAQLICALQEPEHRTPELMKLRSALIDELVSEVSALPRSGFAVRQHLRYVEFYSDKEHYSPLTEEDTGLMARELAPLMGSGEKEELLHVHRLILRRELDLLLAREGGETLSLLSRLIPGSGSADVPELESIRRSFSLQIPSAPIITDFDDELLSVDWLRSGL